MTMLTLIRGGGDLASGVAFRLVHAGLKVVITELPQPLAVRRLVSFSEAIYTGECTVEGMSARLVKDPTDTLKIIQVLAKNHIPVLIDPDGQAIPALHPGIVIDARMLKQRAELIPERGILIIGLGPGFVAGENCHAAVETNRGHYLGRVFWKGAPQDDTGIPENVANHQLDRILRAPSSGLFKTQVEIGDHVETGQPVAEVNGQAIQAAFSGVVRGLLRDGIEVQQGWKVGDVDPRDNPEYCRLISDKSLAIAGGVLEAILSQNNLRPHLWS